MLPAKGVDLGKRRMRVEGGNPILEGVDMSAPATAGQA
jgi:hypothetical protein